MKPELKATALLIGLLALRISYGAGTGSNDDQQPSPPYTAEPGPEAVGTLLLEWQDISRERTIPVKIYYPTPGRQACPVILFSHGTGGSREGYEYLGRHWASYGYVCVHVQHAGSDKDIFQPGVKPLEAVKQSAGNLQNALERPRDISFALDQLTLLNQQAESPLFGRLDLQHVGVAGHSFGAYTAEMVAGRVISLPRGGELDQRDRRISACISMSHFPDDNERTRASYGQWQQPCLHMTGTKDKSPIKESTPAMSRLSYDSSDGSNQYLITFQDGDHMVFSDRERILNKTQRQQDEQIQRMIRISTTAFWNAYLRQDAAAHCWLSGDGLRDQLGTVGLLEMKNPAPRCDSDATSQPAAQPTSRSIGQ
ncbi:MAG: hypothetical protein HJJLKODD_01351 [Phycisphaerae bacterium]|nr:hypothetical protein [Phycisphaerae bacterium]